MSHVDITQTIHSWHSCWTHPPLLYDKVLAYWENHGEALIEAPRDSRLEIVAMDRRCGSLQLNFGNPWEEPPDMTIR